MTSAKHLARHHHVSVVNFGCPVDCHLRTRRDSQYRHCGNELRDQNPGILHAAVKLYETSSGRFDVADIRNKILRHTEVQHFESAGHRIGVHPRASHSHYGREYQGDNHQSSIENHSNPREGLFVAPFQFETGYRQPTVQPSVAFPRPKQISAPDQQSAAQNSKSIIHPFTPVAQRKEHRTSNPRVAGSTPAGRAINLAAFDRCRNAESIGQLTRRCTASFYSSLRASHPPQDVAQQPAGVEATPPAGIFSHAARLTA